MILFGYLNKVMRVTTYFWAHYIIVSKEEYTYFANIAWKKHENLQSFVVKRLGKSYLVVKMEMGDSKQYLNKIDFCSIEQPYNRPVMFSVQLS
jgi:hypothetical protein